MTHVRKRNPDHALARTAGTKEDHSNPANNLPQIYATCCDLQTRHLHRRLGLTKSRATLIAALVFGEGTR